MKTEAVKVEGETVAMASPEVEREGLLLSAKVTQLGEVYTASLCVRSKDELATPIPIASKKGIKTFRKGVVQFQRYLKDIEG